MPKPFNLFVDGSWVGEFVSPFNFSFHYRYYCTRCGGVFAMRLCQDEGAPWHYVPGICKDCAPKGYVSPVDWQYFRTPQEAMNDFAPREILAQEFLHNDVLFKDIENERSGTIGPDSPSFAPNSRPQNCALWGQRDR